MAKFCFIMRGVPGSGKSTTARQIINSAMKPGLIHRTRPGMAEAIFSEDGFGPFKCIARIHATDTYFYDLDGTYNFDPSKLKEYHEANYKSFLHDVEDLGIELVIVDNTNTQTWEWKHYHEAAINNGYITSIVEMPHPPAELCFGRNTHGVPLEGIKAMLNRWQSTQ